MLTPVFVCSPPTRFGGMATLHISLSAIIHEVVQVAEKLLERHRIASKRGKNAFRFDGVMRSISDLKIFPPLCGKGRYEVTFKMKSEPDQVEVLPGDLSIDLDQPNGRLAPLLLEPDSTTSIYREQDYINTFTEGSSLWAEVLSVLTESQ